MSAVKEVAEKGKESSHRLFTELCLLQYIYFVWQNNLAGSLVEDRIFQDDIKV